MSSTGVTTGGTCSWTTRTDVGFWDCWVGLDRWTSRPIRRAGDSASHHFQSRNTRHTSGARFSLSQWKRLRCCGLEAAFLFSRRFM
jgi:hypothetical protein